MINIFKIVPMTNFHVQDGGMEEVRKLNKDTLMRLL